MRKEQKVAKAMEGKLRLTRLCAGAYEYPGFYVERIGNYQRGHNWLVRDERGRSKPRELAVYSLSDVRRVIAAWKEQS